MEILSTFYFLRSNIGVKIRLLNKEIEIQNLTSKPMGVGKKNSENIHKQIATKNKPKS